MRTRPQRWRVATVSVASALQFPTRANAEINFRNCASAEGSLARRGGRPIPRKGWDPFFPPRLDLPTQHSQRPLKGMGPLLPICAPALSQAILSEWLGRRPGRNGLSAASSAQGQGLWTLALASSSQRGHFASAIWKFLSAFALGQRSCRERRTRLMAVRPSRTGSVRPVRRICPASRSMILISRRCVRLTTIERSRRTKRLLGSRLSH